MNQWNNIYTVNWSRRIGETYMQSMYTDERVFQVNGQVNMRHIQFSISTGLEDLSAKLQKVSYIKLCFQLISACFAQSNGT